MLGDPDPTPEKVSRIEVTLPDWIDQVVDRSHIFRTDVEKMGLAIELSRQNVLRNTGGPFGAAIIDADTGLIVGVGVNRVVPLNNSTLHGEMVAIMLAEGSQGSFSLAAGGARRELFTSCEPCAMCMGATLWSGVSRLVTGATGEDARAIGFDEGPVFQASYDYLERAGIQVVRGIEREAANAVLQEYAALNRAIYNGRIGG